MTDGIEILALAGVPMVEPGDDLASLVLQSIEQSGIALRHDDVVVLAQKIVSKAEGRYAYLNEVTVSHAAQDLAAKTGKDPRQMALVLAESSEVLRAKPGVVIVEHKNGYVLANAGIDKSNITSDPDNPRVLLLPEDADRSARLLRDELAARTGIRPAVIINDSVGRAWRVGTVGIAIGCAGLAPVKNQIGEKDLFGNTLEVTMPAVADELAAAASLAMGQAAEKTPLVLVRGASFSAQEGTGQKALLRTRSEDMFR